MSTKQCLKCNHIASFDGAPPLACPQCGAIYSKVEEALRANAPLRPPRSSHPSSGFAHTEPPRSLRSANATPATEEPDVHAFARRMRGESLYPAWRKIVGLVTILWYVVAVVALIIGIVSTKGSFVGVLAGAGTAAFIALFARIGKELSLMVADLSDASVYMAAQTSTNVD